MTTVCPDPCVSAGVVLRINLENAVTDDDVALALNGNPLTLDKAVRSYGGLVAPYESQWLEIELGQCGHDAGATPSKSPLTADRRISTARSPSSIWRSSASSPTFPPSMRSRSANAGDANDTLDLRQRPAAETG